MTPDHLEPLPEEDVADICQRISQEIVLFGVLTLELNAFEETRTPHDARRLANALRHVADRPDLADAVEALIPKS